MTHKHRRAQSGYCEPDLSGPQRLQRVLAACGVGSRRECEQLMLDGRVEVDGRVVTELGVKVDARQQTIAVDGVHVRSPRLQYFMLNKPPGVISTSRDPSGRVRVIDLIQTDQRVYNVGRLDKSSEGLILVTNDGDLANQLTHPRFGVEKKYHVFVAGRPEREDLKRLTHGIYLEEAKVRVSNIRVRKNLRDGTWLEITLNEGRNREIRRMLAKCGHKVLRLRRVAIGPLQMGDLPIGSHRMLFPEEVQVLKRAAARSKSQGISQERKFFGTPDQPARSRFKKFNKMRPDSRRNKSTRFGEVDFQLGSRKARAAESKFRTPKRQLSSVQISTARLELDEGFGTSKLPKHPPHSGFRRKKNFRRTRDGDQQRANHSKSEYSRTQHSTSDSLAEHLQIDQPSRKHSRPGKARHFRKPHRRRQSTGSDRLSRSERFSRSDQLSRPERLGRDKTYSRMEQPLKTRPARRPKASRPGKRFRRKR